MSQALERIEEALKKFEEEMFSEAKEIQEANGEDCCNCYRDDFHTATIIASQKFRDIALSFRHETIEECIGIVEHLKAVPLYSIEAQSAASQHSYNSAITLLKMLKDIDNLDKDKVAFLQSSDTTK